MLSTEKNNINNLLNDDAFIAWVTSGKKTNNTYWEGLKVGLSNSDKNAFNKAVTILTKLRTLHIDDDKSVKSQDFIKKQYNNLMADYNASENKNSKVFKLNNWLKYAAVLVVSISIIGFVYSEKELLTGYNSLYLPNSHIVTQRLQRKSVTSYTQNLFLRCPM